MGLDGDAADQLGAGCAAELGTFLDAYKEWLPQKLEEQICFAVACRGVAVLMCQEVTIPVDGPPQRWPEREGLEHLILRD